MAQIQGGTEAKNQEGTQGPAGSLIVPSASHDLEDEKERAIAKAALSIAELGQPD